MSAYKFKYELNGTRIYPVLSKGATKRWQQPNGRVYFRVDINGNFTILRSDFEQINGASVNTLFTLVISELIIDHENGNTWEEYATGTFYKNDVDEIDEDKRIVRFKIETVDRYKKFIDAFDREIDLIKEISPQPYAVNITKEPLIQMAFPYHNQLWNMCGHANWITELATIYSSTELEAFGFIHEDDPKIFIPGSGQLVPDVSGIYEQSGVNQFTRNDGVYRLTRTLLTTKWALQEISSGDIKFWTPDDGTIPGDHTLLDRGPFSSGFVLENYDDPTLESCMPFPVWHHQRVLTDATEVDGTPTIALPTDDIDGIKFNYANRIDMSGLVALYMVIQPEDNHTGIKTAFGRYADDAEHFAGEYFNPTIEPFVFTRAFPLFFQRWTQYSVSTYLNGGFYALLEEAKTTITVSHCYKIAEVIKLMLPLIDDTITFDETVYHSRFLFDNDNPLTGDTQNFTHFITPKSNILVGTYTSPAPKAPIKYNYIDELMLRLQLHFTIDESGMLKYEHLQYYKNGKSYNNEIVGEDLTVQEEPRVDKAWAYHTNKYRYRKENMPQFLLFPWMDESSEVFDGKPIEHMSPFVRKGESTDKRVSNFTSDITTGQTQSDIFSKDGFYIFAAEFVDEAYSVPFVTIAAPDGGPSYTVQNGWWSNSNIHDKFWRHQAACLEIKLNDEEIEAMSVQRTREQDVLIPVNPDPLRLVTTSVGVGEIVEMEEVMSNRSNKIKVLHDIE